MTTAGLIASVEIAHEARSWRSAPNGADGGHTLRVVTGDQVRVAALLGRAPELARAAARGTLASGADLVALLGVADGRTFVERATELHDARPDLVVVLATDRRDADRLVDLVEALRFGCADQRPAPQVLVSADERTRLRLETAMAPTPLEALPDVRTDAGRDALVARLRAVRRRARSDVALRDEALEAAARRLAADAGTDVVILDVTGISTSAVHAAVGGATQGIHARLGVGAAADRVVARAGLDRVRRWIPRAVEAPALLERVFNRARWPDAVPAAILSLALEMALAREAIAHALADAERAGISTQPFRSAPQVVLAGRLAAFPRPAQSLLVAIDGLEPTGATLVSRAGDALVAAGALVSRGLADAALAADRIALVTTLWPRRSATLRVSGAEGVSEERVARGSFFLVPSRGPVEVTASGTALRARAEPLALGVVIDARGRPLVLPPRDAERVPTVTRWHQALDALPAEPRP